VTSGPPTLVYDGDCGICDASVRLLRRARCDATMVTSRTWVLDHPEHAEAATTSVLLVADDGTVLEGEVAVAAVLRRCRRPLPWLGAALGLPLVRVAAHHVYRLVADHRTRLSALVGLRACAVPDGTGP